VRLSVFLYRIITGFYYAGILLASIFNKKAKLWINGRKNLFTDLVVKIKNHNPAQKKYWFHCASLGEFEQGRPLIEAIKIKEPSAFIILSFFSPSGYELQKNYKGADLVTYLPADSASNAKKFLEILKPDVVFFIKYEFWYFFLREAHERKIELYLISAHFRTKQLFFSNFGALHRKMLTFYSYIFVQDQLSQSLLKKIGIEKVLVSGDTRYDRVLDIKAQKKKLPEIDKFKNGFKLLVCGSSWPADEIIISKLWKNHLKNKGWKLIIAPHEISQDKINKLQSSFEKTSPTLLYSNISEQSVRKYDVLIIDNIGMLSSIYSYANVAYIGGGFGRGIHNILEAAVFDIPVFFGPNHHKFIEADALKNIGQAFDIKSADELSEKIEKLNFEKIKEDSNTYFQQQSAVCKKILSKIQ
jgi:3-deoxy-D-manno-octulosonic-acid transferase